MIRTITNMVRSLLYQAHCPLLYWVEALNVATHIINLLPTKTLKLLTPHEVLYRVPPTYSHLHTFGCLCYPNISISAPHKLAPRSSPCVFLGYPTTHRGYRCLELSTGKVIISRHVTFDELSFPLASSPTTSTSPPNFDEDDQPLINLPTAQSHLQPCTTPQPAQPTIVEPDPAVPSPPAAPPAAPTASHPMLTRAKAGITKPRIPFSLHTTTIASPIPTTYRQALQDPNWRNAMLMEFSALIKNKTWDLVPRPPHFNVISGKWLYRHKFNADGSLERYKARWVARGFTQQPGVDYTETFSPVIKPTTIRTVLSLALSRSWPIHQLDVTNAFLHGSLSEPVYCEQPSGFVDPACPDHVCLLRKALYGLKQAPRAWFQRFTDFICTQGFIGSKTDSSLFVYHHGDQLAYLLLYVDDIVLTASSLELLRSITARLSREFDMKDLGPLHYFLGISVSRTASGLFLSQHKFASEILARAAMADCNPCRTPSDTSSKLSAFSGSPAPDPSLYRSIVGALQYLTFTRPDICYAVQQVCLFMHDPRASHLAALKRILRYLKGTLDYGLHLFPTRDFRLTAYSDADWGGCPDTRRSTSGYCVYFGDNLISWSSKRQQSTSRSSAEAEYRAVANAVAETSWLRQLLVDLRCPPTHATLVYCDNVSAVYLSSNPVHHQRTKHVEIDIHFVRDQVALGRVRVLHVPSSLQYADIFTKGLPSALFREFVSSLHVRGPSVSTAGAC